jgi:hypothetical protein
MSRLLDYYYKVPEKKSNEVTLESIIETCPSNTIVRNYMRKYIDRLCSRQQEAEFIQIKLYMDENE